MQAKGRGLHVPMIDVRTDAGEFVFVRIDCDRNSEFWVELLIRPEELEAWAKAHREGRAQEDAERPPIMPFSESP